MNDAKRLKTKLDKKIEELSNNYGDEILLSAVELYKSGQSLIGMPGFSIEENEAGSVSLVPEPYNKGHLAELIAIIMLDALAVVFIECFKMTEEQALNAVLLFALRNVERDNLYEKLGVTQNGKI